MNYDFPITTVPIKANGQEIPKKAAVLRTDTNEPLGIVSNQYGLLTHTDVIDSLRHVLSGQKYEEQIQLTKNGAHLFASYKLTDIQIEPKLNDFVSMRLIGRNSYDGTKSFTMMLGAFRLVCSNGMVIGKELFSFRQRHISSVVSLDQELLDSKVGDLIGTFKRSLPIMKTMTKTPANVDESFFDKDKISMPNYLVKEALEIYENDKQKTVWNLYNAFTSVITHNLRKENPKTQIKFAKAAWSMATELVAS